MKQKNKQSYPVREPRFSKEPQDAERIYITSARWEVTPFEACMAFRSFNATSGPSQAWVSTRLPDKSPAEVQKLVIE
jgi:hypothetical protein